MEGETPSDGGDGDKGGKFPNDFDEEKVQVTIATKPAVQDTGAIKHGFKRPDPPNLWYKRPEPPNLRYKRPEPPNLRYKRPEPPNLR